MRQQRALSAALQNSSPEGHFKPAVSHLYGRLWLRWNKIEHEDASVLSLSVRTDTTTNAISIPAKQTGTQPRLMFPFSLSLISMAF